MRICLKLVIFALNEKKIPKGIFGADFIFALNEKKFPSSSQIDFLMLTSNRGGQSTGFKRSRSCAEL